MNNLGHIYSTNVNLFNLYKIQEAGKYTIQLCCQADENLADEPDGLCGGVFCSEKREFLNPVG